MLSSEFSNSLQFETPVLYPLLSDRPREIAFIDSTLLNYNQLATGLQSSTEVYLLNPNQDGIAQINSVLSERLDITTLHIFSHARDGAVQLGATTLNLTNIGNYTDKLQSWSEALTVNADVLFYGCNLAASDWGQQLVQQISILTQADVAASDDLTGNADLGGDWELEVQTGKIETPLAINTSLQNSYQGVLDWQQQAKLGFVGNFDRFGISVGIDGNTAIVGAPGDVGPSVIEGGIAYIYQFDGSAWVKQADLTAGSGDSSYRDYFGETVAIDGDRVIIGAPGDNGSSISEGDIGAAYIFERNGSSWVRQTKLRANDVGASDQFGSSVAMDGDWAIVGALYDDNNFGVDSGCAYIFRFNGSNWVQYAKLTANDGAAFDYFGNSVAISGNTAIVGAVNDDDANLGADVGAAYVYQFDGTQWVQQAKLTATDSNVFKYFGGSVSIDGTTAIVGAAGENFNRGSAYIYQFNGTSWVEQVKLISNDVAQGDRFGNSVSISNNRVVVGALFDDNDLGTDSGSAYVYQFNGSTWVQETKLIPNNGVAYNRIGTSVDISGGTVIAGAPFGDRFGNGNGSAYLFSANSNSSPIANNDSFAVNEDTPLSGNVLADNGNGADSDPDNNPLTVQLVQTPSNASSFNLNPDGTFSYLPQINFNGTDTFTYQLSDGLTTSDVATVTITLAAVNDTPTDLALSVTSIDENVPIGLIGTFSTTDVDSNSFTYSLVDTANYSDNTAFSIINNQLQLNISPDFETKSTYTIRVRTTDQGELSFDKEFTIAINDVIEDVNQAPTAITLSNTSVTENELGAAIGVLTVIDPDANDTHVFSVSDDRFVVQYGQLRLRSDVSLDYETTPTVNLFVTAADSGGLSKEQSFTITVLNVNENAAATAITLSNTSVIENEPGATIGLLTVIDPDANDTHVFSVSDDRFVVANGLLKLRSDVSLDYETTPAINLFVTAVDSGGLSKEQSFSITVLNTNEAPTAIALSNTVETENASGAVIGTLTVTDLDANDSHVFSVSDDRFVVENGLLKLKNGISLDYETTPTIDLLVTVTDSGGLSKEQSFTITVLNVDEKVAPTAITLSNTSVIENASGAVVGTLTVTDPDVNDTHTFNLGDNRFEFVNNQLKLKNGISIDYETTPTIDLLVTATDSGGFSKEQAFTISVVNVNEAPITITLSNTSVTENASGAVIGMLTVIDPDANDSHIFSVSDTRFEVVNNQLKLKNSISLNYEIIPTINLLMTATDSGGLSKEQAFTITVLNINEAPIANPDTLTVNQSTTKTFSVSSLLRNDSDPDISTTLRIIAVSDLSSSIGTITLSDNNTPTNFTDDYLVFTPTFNSRFSGSTAFRYELSDGSLNRIGVVTLIVGKSIDGSDRSDTLTGNAGEDVLFGNKSNDVLFGGMGNDYLFGGSGNDRLNGDEGNDFLSGDGGDDTLNGGNGNDIFVLSIDKGTDTIQDFQLGQDIIGLAGGLTFSQLTFRRVLSKVVNYYAIEDSNTGKTLAILENFNGSLKSEDFVSLSTTNGTYGDDEINGGSSDDCLIGGSGNDTLTGGAGFDVFLLGTSEGTDTIKDFQQGQDLIGLSGTLTFSQLNLRIDKYGTYIEVTSTGEVLAFVKNVSLKREDFAIVPINVTSNDDDVLYGSQENDGLFGGAGNDLLIGNSGDDFLNGGFGNDTLNGQEDNDVLYGGEGSDIFVLSDDNGKDRILDFSQGRDRIGLVGGLTFTGLTTRIVYTSKFGDGYTEIIERGTGKVLATLENFIGQLREEDFIIL
ncbi:DUF4347 domain-containing protein [Tolypothrix sp. FACHB-123]|uniref:DUF4347 domain-containing protein n=1 Tax=Tolypothrix sp. FACHB-123 TaxID=2692868 RepID=UPI001688567C|nr:DUF4347 domain-containing protein [Tolypothrix sp. FACHB-123]MBD2357668.1 DUF4347 domain-containing protein [Tolypothrix sp. FACHB-123]